jgi:hypothetical protein
MGGASSVKRTKTLGSDWTLLEWGVFAGFSITMGTDGVRLRKVTAWIPYGETTSKTLGIGWYQTIPWGGIQAKGRPGQTVEYTYSP